MHLLMISLVVLSFSVSALSSTLLSNNASLVSSKYPLRYSEYKKQLYNDAADMASKKMIKSDSEKQSHENDVSLESQIIVELREVIEGLEIRHSQDVEKLKSDHTYFNRKRSREIAGLKSKLQNKQAEQTDTLTKFNNCKSDLHLANNESTGCNSDLVVSRLESRRCKSLLQSTGNDLRNCKSDLQMSDDGLRSCETERSADKEVIGSYRKQVLDISSESEWIDIGSTFPNAGRIQSTFVNLGQSEEWFEVAEELMEASPHTTEQEILKVLVDVFYLSYEKASHVYKGMIATLNYVFQQKTIPDSVMSCVTPFFQKNYEDKLYFSAVGIVPEVLDGLKMWQRTSGMKSLVEKLLNMSWVMVLSGPACRLGRRDKNSDSSCSFGRVIWPSLVCNGQVLVEPKCG